MSRYTAAWGKRRESQELMAKMGTIQRIPTTFGRGERGRRAGERAGGRRESRRAGGRVRADVREGVRAGVRADVRAGVS